MVLLGIGFIIAGVLVLLAGVFGKVGLFGFGTEAAMERRRTLSRAKALIAGPLIVGIGVAILVAALSG